MFYDMINVRCREKGISISKMLIDVGMSKSAATKWKDSTYEPSNETLKKIADYFNITVSELLGEETEKLTVNNDSELTDYLQELSTRPEMKMLFKVSKAATKEQVEQVVKMFEAFQK